MRRLDAAIEIKGGPGAVEIGTGAAAPDEGCPTKPGNKEKGGPKSLDELKPYHKVRKPNL